MNNKLVTPENKEILKKKSSAGYCNFPQKRMNEFAVEKVQLHVSFKVFSLVLKTRSWNEQWYHGNL